MVPWSLGKCLIWDVTCVDTLAPSHLEMSKNQVGYAAVEAEKRKVAKYKTLTIHILPCGN